MKKKEKKKKEKEKQSFKKIKKEKEDIILDPLKFKNETGMYELIAVLTHRGRMADSGHYVSWVKQGSDEWLKFDDDKLSIVNDEEIKKLSGKGGADWHIAYLCIYQSKNVDVIELEKIQKELQNLKKE
jgi:ubiquitin carboxyl-terminal hydrolase 14